MSTDGVRQRKRKSERRQGRVRRGKEGRRENRRIKEGRRNKKTMVRT